MTDDPDQPSSDEADLHKQPTPAGIVEDIEEEAEETGATFEPAPPNPPHS